ncbi:lantibiotic dehydratase [Streptomyces sp. NPDC017979]|uniref:lantibiotic dehydratase n=1 Tax=Streptomyces sp. NPDC017979 TaxID=3365024 RepID=UPI003797861D
MVDVGSVRRVPFPQLGTAALARVAAVPCSLWAGAGNPLLFARLAAHADAAVRQSGRARRLAEKVGEVVPDARLSDPERHALLALRRRLHSGAAPRPEECRLLDRLTAAPARLAREATALVRAARQADAVQADIERALLDERQRIGALSWALLDQSPVLRTFVDAATPGLTREVAAYLARGETWTGKRLRKRSGYLWRAVARAAVKTTPRGWACHVALVPVGGVNGWAGTRLLPPGAVVGALAATTAENVHGVRARLTAADPWDTEAPIAYAPAALHVTDPDGRLRCYGVDPDDLGRMRQVAVRRTAPLDAVLALLADGPRPLAEVERALVGSAGPGGSAALRAFLSHLVRLGVLQPCGTPRHHASAWVPPVHVTGPEALPQPRPAPSSRTHPAPEARPGARSRADDEGWFVDSYRAVDATVPDAGVARVERALAVAARVVALRQADQLARPAPAPPPGTRVLDDHPRPLSALLAQLLSVQGPETAAPHPSRYAGWHPAHVTGSGYDRLLTHIGRHRGDETIDLDHALLDSMGAPSTAEALPAWPLDCLLRPLVGATGPVAVLETASAAGVLDARFADGLKALHGRYGPVESYRSFLAAVERRAGVRFVELLVPPVGERAANAVRRPVTTRWWTGDPHHAAYCTPGGPPQRYLPLDRITLRRAPAGAAPGTRAVAEADGERIVPVYHATRAPMPPYNLLVGLLLRASHPAANTVIRLDCPATAFDRTPDEVTRTPRLTVGGELVVAPATWRVPRALLWSPRVGDFAKARALAALRHSARLPRFVFVRPAQDSKPMPVDLEALPTLTLIERMCASRPGEELLLEEMLPGPDQLTLRDPTHQGAAVAGQLLLRVSRTRDPVALAALAAAALTQGVPAPSSARGTAAGTVTAHPPERREVPCPPTN